MCARTPAYHVEHDGWGSARWRERVLEEVGYLAHAAEPGKIWITPTSTLLSVRMLPPKYPARSRITPERPLRASSTAVDRPANPPPITTTGTSEAMFIVN